MLASHTDLFFSHLLCSYNCVLWRLPSSAYLISAFKQDYTVSVRDGQSLMDVEDAVSF